MCVCLKDLLRGFGAWSLVSWVAYGRDRYAPGAERLGGAEPGGGWTLSAAVLLPRHGDLAVPLSFLVSGLVLFWPYATRTRAMETPGDVLAFWRRRTARLLPLYWLSVLFRHPTLKSLLVLYNTYHRLVSPSQTLCGW